VGAPLSCTARATLRFFTRRSFGRSKSASKAESYSGNFVTGSAGDTLEASPDPISATFSPHLPL
jgi:hypothetical protein